MIGTIMILPTMIFDPFCYNQQNLSIDYYFHKDIFTMYCLDLNMGRNKNSKCCTICRRRRLPDSNFTLFSFPLDVDRCLMWIQTAGLEDLLHIPIELIQSNRLICESHFTPECFKPYRRKCLTQSAVPTLNLKHPPLSHELLAKFPLHVGKENINTGYNPLREHNYGVRMRFTLENMDKTEKARNPSCVQLAEIPVASTSKTPDAFRVAKLPLGPISQFAEIPVASSSKTPDSLNDESKTSVVKGHIRTKSSNSHVKTSTLTAREKRLLAKLQSAKVTLKTLAKSRMNLENLDSDMLKEFASNMLSNQKKKPEAKRWTIANKIYSLAIYKRSPKAYRFMSKFIALPSTKTLNRLIRDMPMDPGLNPHIASILKKKVSKMNFENKSCSLLFDEMALKKRLIYNEVTDKVEGYLDLGSREGMGRANKIANHALVFLIQGLGFKYKQYLGHYFTEGTISTANLATIILHIVKSRHEIGFIVITTVCDQGSTNIGAINTLKKLNGGTADDNFFYCDGQKIFIIYDVPHLFKSLRNNFYNAGNIKYKGKSGKWSHLIAAEEQNRNFLNFPKLNLTITNPTFKNKMRVKYAAHALSNIVSAILKMMAWKTDSDVIKNELIDTAYIIEELDKLFDCTNGPASPKDVKKGIRENVSKKSSHIESWNYYLQHLENTEFINSETLSKLKNVKCIKGYIITLKSLKDIWLKLEHAGFTYLNLRQLNQDCLENFFGIIRQHSVTNRNPTVSHFTAALKATMVSGLRAPHSKSANCENDNNKILIEYKDLLEDIKKPEAVVTKMPENLLVDEISYPVLSITDEPEPIEQYVEALDSFAEQPIVYVSGYLAAKLLVKNDCLECKNCLSVEHSDDELYRFLTYKEWFPEKHSLTYPSKHLCATLRSANKIFNDSLSDQLYKENIGQITFMELSNTCCFSWFTCQTHFKEVEEKLFRYISLLFIRKSCKIINKSFIKHENELADKSKRAQQLGE